MLRTTLHTKLWELKLNELTCWKIKSTTTHLIWNRSVKNFIIIKEIEFIVRNSPQKKSLILGGFNGEFYQIFKEELAPFVPFFFPEEGTISSLFYETGITWY